MVTDSRPEPPRAPLVTIKIKIRLGSCIHDVGRRILSTLPRSSNACRRLDSNRERKRKPAVIKEDGVNAPSSFCSWVHSQFDLFPARPLRKRRMLTMSFTCRPAAKRESLAHPSKMGRLFLRRRDDARVLYATFADSRFGKTSTFGSRTRAKG